MIFLISRGFQHACSAVCHSAVCVCIDHAICYKASLDVSEELDCLQCLISFWCICYRFS